MLSILIPTYNYNVYPLVSELHRQCLKSKINFEILCQDDSSKTFEPENLKINNLENCRFEVLEKNIGRSGIRNLLAQKAQFDILLFLDADTIPVHTDFIQKYVNQINDSEKVVFGGIEYQKEKPNNDQLLRWIYGNARESLSVEKRNTNPNINALTSNLLINKNVFVSNQFDKSIISYGYEDLLFLSELKKKQIVVKHIHNPTYHMGLETSQQFLDKTKTALENLKLISKNSLLESHESKILSSYSFLKRFYLTALITFLFKKTERKITKNLLSQKPYLMLFDLYKLGYYCCIQSQ